MAKRVFLIHGWGGSPLGGWFPWLIGELKKKGFEVHAPQMPETDNPIIEKWVSRLAKVVGIPDKDAYFIGGSIGCQAVLRYLETIETPIGGALLVAGFFNLTGLVSEEDKAIAEPWLETPIDFDKVKHSAKKITALFSTNDPLVPLSNKDMFKQNLDAKIVVEKNVGHFDGQKYDIILEEFLKLAK